MGDAGLRLHGQAAFADRTQPGRRQDDRGGRVGRHRQVPSQGVPVHSPRASELPVAGRQRGVDPLQGHARYVAFQMAEVAVPKTLFAEILQMIAELRPPPVASTA